MLVHSHGQEDGTKRTGDKEEGDGTVNAGRRALGEGCEGNGRGRDFDLQPLTSDPDRRTEGRGL